MSIQYSARLPITAAPRGRTRCWPAARPSAAGIYYTQQKFEEAVKIFELAVLAKPDYANSHYNLAMAYKANKQIDKAKEQMEIVLKLVETNSPDYETAKKELEKMNISESELVRFR